MQLFHISQFTIELITELPLRTTAILGVLRRSFLCIADSVNYSIVDLNEKTLVPLLPISQDPPDDEPADGDAPRTEAKPKSYQKPSIMPVEEDEFLVASHTGHTTLGLFIRENGEPTRGTLEWASNPKSIGGAKLSSSGCMSVRADQTHLQSFLCRPVVSQLSTSHTSSLYSKIIPLRYMTSTHKRACK